MNLTKKLILCAAVAATTFAAMPVQAGDRWRDHRGHRGHHDRDGGAIVAAGVLGLALGALAVGVATSNDDEPVNVNPYRHPRPRPDRDVIYGDVSELVDEPQYEPSFEPWSRSWYRYCEQRYRSFDAKTGTFMGYDGREHFCDAG